MSDNQSNLFDNNEMIPEEITFTRVKVFQRCPLEFRYRFIDSHDSGFSYGPGGVDVALGRLIHNIADKFFSIKQENQRNFEYNTIFEESWEKYESSFKSGADYYRGIVSNYFERLINSELSNFKILFNELGFKALYRGYLLRGRVDLICQFDNHDMILDLKIDSREFTHLQDPTDKFLQPIFYYYGIYKKMRLQNLKVGVYYFSSGEIEMIDIDKSTLENGWNKIVDIHKKSLSSKSYDPIKNELCSMCVVKKRGECPLWGD